MTAVGERIGAILSANTEHVRFLGFGVYVGNEVPPRPAPMLGAKTWEEFDEMMSDSEASLRESGEWPMRHPNPKLVLDNGDVVWGQECWWGPEARVQQILDSHRENGAEIETTEITSARTSENSQQ
jgi:hypothetical protein